MIFDAGNNEKLFFVRVSQNMMNITYLMKEPVKGVFINKRLPSIQGHGLDDHSLSMMCSVMFPNKILLAAMAACPRMRGTIESMDSPSGALWQ